MIAVDQDGTVYITGLTRSKKDFPVIAAQQAEFCGGKQDAFIVKLAAGGNKVDPWVHFR